MRSTTTFHKIAILTMLSESSSVSDPSDLPPNRLGTRLFEQSSVFSIFWSSAWPGQTIRTTAVYPSNPALAAFGSGLHVYTNHISPEGPLSSFHPALPKRSDSRQSVPARKEHLCCRRNHSHESAAPCPPWLDTIPRRSTPRGTNAKHRGAAIVLSAR